MSPSAEEGGRLQIVTAIFPEYDWVMNILGNNPSGSEVTMLLDNGVDLHSYQPTAEDILKISACDMFIYVGGESDEWVEDALKEAVNKDICRLWRITSRFLKRLLNRIRKYWTGSVRNRCVRYI